MKVIIAGGRRVRLGARECARLAALHARHEFAEVVCGGARGVDEDAACWARSHGIKVTIFPAAWRRYGRAAGPLRNRKMLEYIAPDGMLVAFPGGRGTANILAQARSLGLAVVDVAAPVFV